MSFAGDEVIYIGTRGVYHEGVAERLRARGAREIIPVDVELDIKLRNQFVREYFEDNGREFARIEDALACGGGAASIAQDTCLYVVRSSVDAPLEEEVPLRDYERYIQAGAALDGHMLEWCEFFDDDGENISCMNRQFCELTALYWIWKNAQNDIVGIEHYRRRFLLPDNWQKAFRGDVDVILPVPLYVWPGIAGNYLARHATGPWETMMEVLKEMDETCYGAAKDFFENTGCYSPCNMLIAKSDVFKELCDWMFPVLFEVRSRCGDYEDAYQNRYFGFLSERLITFFFYWKRDVYRVVYADKSFLR
jgi:hypothetical protein